MERFDSNTRGTNTARAPHLYLITGLKPSPSYRRGRGGEVRRGREEEEASTETTPVAVRRLIEFKGWNVSCAGTVCSWQPRFGIVEGGAGPERGE